MGKGSSGKVYDFYYSIALGVCAGPVDAFNFIQMKDKIAAATRITAETLGLELDKKKLFGGDSGEGGPRGYVDYHMGNGTQLMSETHASKHGLPASDLPGYRHLAYLFFYGRGGETIGFRWTTNIPYFPEIAVGVTRNPVAPTIPNVIWPIVGVNEETGEYVIAQDGEAFVSDDEIKRDYLPDANPAAIIYEAMTADWGKQELASSIEVSTFVSAADTLANEHFGMSLTWTQEDEIEAFVGEVLDHIRGVLFEHPVTGKWNLKLLRDDYSIGALSVLDPSNATLETIKRRTWGDTVSEIIVRYTHPVTEKPESVSAMNYANVTIQGGVRSETRDYIGIRNPWLAMNVAERDVYEASRTLLSVRARVRRGTDTVLPGHVILLNWPEEQIYNLPMRVQKIDRGDSDDRGLVVDLVEDVYATKRPISWLSVWGPDAAAGTPVDLDRVFIMSVPASLLPGVGVSPADAAGAHPAAVVAFIANSTAKRPYEIEAYGSIVAGNGSVSDGVLATFLPSGFGTLGVALTPEAHSTIPGASVEALFGQDAGAGQVFGIGDDEDTHELVMLDAYNSGADTWTVIRGLYDTQPLSWDDTAQTVRIDFTDDNLDGGNPVVGVPESYRFLPTVDGTTLLLEDATAHDYTPTARASAPYRPANCQIDGNGFEATIYTEMTVPETIPLTWENRNRLSEDAVAMAWDGGNVTPEVGQTTTIRVRNSVDVIALEVTGLTGTSYDLDPDTLTAAQVYFVEFISVRDGIECVYPVRRELRLPNNAGWNYNWNNFWN